MKDSHSPSLLIVGGTKAGKTHYGGQLLRRLESKMHPLRINGVPSDLTPFYEVLESLSEGRSAPHTPTTFYRESVWNVRHDPLGYDAELVWPDYGGEQIEDIVRHRHITLPWIERIRQSRGWLFFVRPSIINMPEDILVRPRGVDHMRSDSEDAVTDDVPEHTKIIDAEPQEDGASVNLSLSTQAGLVELLQALLFVKHVGSSSKINNPSLVVVMSCLDEIESKPQEMGTKPVELLKDRLPLLNQFIQSTWYSENVDVFGLSALGKALDAHVSDESFKENGPERQGWCVEPDGQLSNDLTAPVVSLMKKILRGS